MIEEFDAVLARPVYNVGSVHGYPWLCFFPNGALPSLTREPDTGAFVVGAANGDSGPTLLRNACAELGAGYSLSHSRTS